MIIGSIKEDLSLEKRVALTPEAAKSIIGLGLKFVSKKIMLSILQESKMRILTKLA